VKPESIHLTLVNTRHNKEYRAELLNLGEGWTVAFAYGAIGSPLKTGIKTPEPVEYEKAKGIYDRLIGEKTLKPCACCMGVYTPANSPQNAPKAVAQCAKVVPISTPTPPKQAAPAAHPAFSPELLEAVPEAAAPRFIQNDRYGMMKKYDGNRMAVSYVPGDLIAFNRLGERIDVPPDLRIAVLKVVRDHAVTALMLDGEYLHGQFVAFDLLVYETDCRSLPFFDRWGMMVRLLMGSTIGAADLYTLTNAKQEAFDTERKNRGEGVVFKKLSAPYMPGRQGTSIKLKFWVQGTVRICKKQKTSTTHSFGMEVLRLNRWVYVGSCTCKGELPALGSYREVKYLYVGAGGHLYQSEDWGARTDVTDADCTWTQLKLKQAKEHAL
jgi:bifunctional non-homologous end joining protein LigD